MDIRIDNGDFYLYNGKTFQQSQDKDIELKIRTMLNSTIGNLNLIKKSKNYNLSNELLNLNSRTLSTQIKQKVEDILTKLKLNNDIKYIVSNQNGITIQFLYIPTKYKFTIYV